MCSHPNWEGIRLIYRLQGMLSDMTNFNWHQLVEYQLQVGRAEYQHVLLIDHPIWTVRHPASLDPSLNESIALLSTRIESSH